MELMKSGRFARICGTTKNTLIHYDSIGILKPSHIGDNGYRYYSIKDYWRFLAIRTFTEAGFSLAEVMSFLASEDEEELIGPIRDTRESLTLQKQHLESSLELLGEMDEQIRCSMSNSEQELRLSDEQKREIVIWGKSPNRHPDDEFDYSALTEMATRATGWEDGMNPLIRLASYGTISLFSNGTVTYGELFSMMPEGIDAKRIGEDRIAAYDALDR